MLQINFKRRLDTKHLYICAYDTKAKTLEQFNLKSMKSGEYDSGFHFFIQKDGTIETARPQNAVCGWFFENPLTSLYIAINAPKSTLNDSQKTALKNITDQLTKTYGELTIHHKKTGVYE